MSGPYITNWGPLFSRNDAAPLGGRAGVNGLGTYSHSKQHMPAPANRNAPEGTSEVAAKMIAPKAGTMRGRVYAAIFAAGTRGLTDDEGQQLTGIRCQTWGPRRHELVSMGLVVDTGERRPTSSGRPAAVWIDASLARNPTRTLPKASHVSDAPEGGQA